MDACQDSNSQNNTNDNQINNNSTYECEICCKSELNHNISKYVTLVGLINQCQIILM